MLQRKITASLLEAAKYYPVLTVTGPRQSGKTTLVKSIFPHKPYISLEDLDQREFATNDPRGFLSLYKDGAILDEVQHCPDLFSYIQTKVDNDQSMGQFVLTGSQNFLLLEKISQSLAGRSAIFHLLPLNFQELNMDLTQIDPFALAIKGFYPKLYATQVNPLQWYNSYIRTYVERDVRQIQNITNLSTFQRFIKMCAGRIGQLINYSSLGTECGVSYNTINSWLSILEASFIIFRLKPYHVNFNKRLVKSEKLFFYDTGLACALLGIENLDQLHHHYLKGGLFENMIIEQFLKEIYAKGKNPSIYFWRDNHGHEIDLLIEHNGIKPVEIKSSQTFNKDFFKNLTYWNNLSKLDQGYLIYAGHLPQSRGNIKIIPWHQMNCLLD